MAKLTLEELRKMRESGKKQIDTRQTHGKEIFIVIGMGTCGIAAGAKSVLNAFIEQLDEKAVVDAVVKQTGCMGLCHSEPTVEIKMPGMPDTIYGKVDAALVPTLIDEHILGKKLVSGHIIDRPAGDIMK